MLLEKQDAVGRKVQHQYDANNLLQVRLWSRTNDTSELAITNLYSGYGEIIALQYNDAPLL